MAVHEKHMLKRVHTEMHAFKIVRVVVHLKQFWERSEVGALSTASGGHAWPCCFAHCTLPSDLKKDHFKIT